VLHGCGHHKNLYCQLPFQISGTASAPTQWHCVKETQEANASVEPNTGPQIRLSFFLILLSNRHTIRSCTRSHQAPDTWSIQSRMSDVFSLTTMICSFHINTASAVGKQTAYRLIKQEYSSNNTLFRVITQKLAWLAHFGNPAWKELQAEETCW